MGLLWQSSDLMVGSCFYESMKKKLATLVWTYAMLTYTALPALGENEAWVYLCAYYELKEREILKFRDP